MENNLGECYQIAYRTFDHLQFQGNYRLVHGMIDGQGPSKGLRFSHAWVEDMDNMMVIDNTLPVMYRILPRDIYYQLAHVNEDQLSRYTSDQVLKYVLDTRVYGPWESQYDQVIQLNK